MTFAYRVHVLASPDDEALGKAPELEEGLPLVLGRAPGPGGIGIKDGKLSRRHASVTLLGGTMLRVRDLGSTNGTLVNRLKVSSDVDLYTDGVIRIGDTVLHAGGVLRGEGDARSTLDPLLREAARDLAAGDHPVAIVASPGTGVRTLARELHLRARRPGPLVLLPGGGWPEEAPERAVPEEPGGTLLLMGAGAATIGGLERLLRRSFDRDTRVVLAATPGESGAMDVVVPEGGRVELPAPESRRLAIWGVTGAWRHERRVAPFSAGATTVWLCAPLPEGYRTLRERFERLLIHAADAEVIRSEHVRAILDPPRLRTEELVPRRMDRPSRAEVLEALARYETMAEVADHFGRDRRQVYRWMDAYGIERPAKGS